MTSSGANSMATVRQVRTVFIWLALGVVLTLSACASVDLNAPPPPSGTRPAAPIVNAPAQVPAPTVPSPAPAPAAPPDNTVIQPAEPFSVTVPELSQPDGPSLKSWVQDHNRLYNVAAPLLIANAELCTNNARRILGFTAKTRYSYSLDFVFAAEAELGLDDRLRVINVLPGSGAEKAGVREGDTLIAINGKELPQGDNAEREAALMLGAETRNQTQADLVVARDNEELVITVPLTQACAFGIELADVSAVMSVADGYRVAISRGMLQAVRSDSELAYVLAHEFAHNLITTRPRPGISTFIDQVRFISLAEKQAPSFDLIPTPSAEAEADADKIALYMLARAGVPIDDYAEFWRLLEAVSPENSIHAPTETRFPAIKRVMNEIARKQAAGATLLP